MCPTMHLYYSIEYSKWNCNLSSLQRKYVIYIGKGPQPTNLTCVGLAHAYARVGSGFEGCSECYFRDAPV